jgi:hypothetical protein
MLYGLSQNSCQNSTKIQFLCHSMLFDNFGMHANAPRNCCCCLFSSARPLSCSLLFSQQECFSSLALGISPRVSFSLNKTAVASTSSCSWHLTKNPLGLSPRFLQLLLQEWVRPLALINLMREGEEFSNLTVEIRLDGWLRFGVSSLTLTLIIKLSFNLHLTN